MLITQFSVKRQVKSTGLGILGAKHRETAVLAERWVASKLGKSPDEVAAMSANERIDEYLKQFAQRKGILYSEATRLADLQVKIDSGQRLSSDEIEFLNEMNQKMKGNW